MSTGPDTSLDHQMYMNYLVSRARAATVALQTSYTNKSLQAAYRDHWMAKIMEELVSLCFLCCFFFLCCIIGAWVHLHWKMSDGQWISVHSSILQVPLQNSCQTVIIYGQDRDHCRITAVRLCLPPLRAICDSTGILESMVVGPKWSTSWWHLIRWV